MRLLIVLLILTSAGGAFGADAYRWVDERGITNYGEKAPADRPSRPVDTRPGGIVEGGAQITDIAQADRRRRAEEARVAVAPARRRPAPAARGLDFDIYIRLFRGMSEGELLMRAGPPDYRAVDNLVDYERSFYYFPTVANPFTTVIKLRGGRIASIERIKKF